ncbi:MAG: hypothetical protein LBE06_03140 [Azoarcus sp.]|jgi:hypothetical protein|nr:hypothetical protein [Azoarcus sp.]
MKKILTPLLALACAGPLAAQDSDGLLRDPTRPPGWRETPVEAAGDGPRLEILWRGGGKQLATISGVQLAVGEEADGLRLVSIGRDEVTIESAQGEQVLRLTPVAEVSGRTGEGK